MRSAILTLVFTSAAWAADEQLLALSLKAQSDYERVAFAAKPALRDADNCVQSQAAILTVAPPEEAALLHYRKGYCALAGAIATGNAGQYAQASAEFDAARDTWPARIKKPVKGAPPEPLSSGLRVIAVVSRLIAPSSSPDLAKAKAELADAADHPACNSNLMGPELCRQLIETGRQWLGWMALKDERFDDAARFLSFADSSGWSDWVQGRRSFESAAYPDAVKNYSKAIDTWKQIWADPAFLRVLGPRPNIPIAQADLGGAQLLAGDTAGAMKTLDASIKADPSNAHAFYLRARAKEIAGQNEAALADYNMASRTAFANAKDLASGEAHLYRGIVLYRHKEFGQAEDEFASALNFEIDARLQADAIAWRHLAAVAGGSCASAREFLNGSLAKVSPFFPRNEARTLAAACTSTAQR